MSDHNPHDVELRFDILHTKRYIFKAHSNEAIRYLVPIVGPTAAAILHHVAGHLEQSPMPYYTTLSKLSHACGGGPGTGGRFTLVTRGLDRLCRFRLAWRKSDGEYLIPTKVPPLDDRQIAHLPLELQRTVPTG